MKNNLDFIKKKNKFYKIIEDLTHYLNNFVGGKGKFK